jgi:hypothetical protein
MKKRYRVKVVDLSEKHHIYINTTMRKMENDGEIYDAFHVHGDIYKVNTHSHKWHFHRKHLEFIESNPIKYPEPQLFDINLLDI